MALETVDEDPIAMSPYPPVTKAFSPPAKEELLSLTEAPAPTAVE